MSRPDVMDRDVATLLGLDAAAFIEAPRPAKRRARPPGWIWYAAPVAIALVVGAGFGLLRLSNDGNRAEQRVEATPPLQAATDPRAMSLQVLKVGKRRSARREAVQAVDFDPTAPADGAAPAALAFAESAGPAPADHAPNPHPLEIASFSMLSDKEIDPNMAPMSTAEPQPHAEASPDADRMEPSTP